jgi:hypothetical protein
MLFHYVIILLFHSKGQTLPTLSNNLCDYDTIYDSIRTGNVVEVNLQVRYRNCPANLYNKPCRASNPQGFAEGPLLNGVLSDNTIVVNDAIPGPEIRANLGDTVRVNVVNYLGEPTTMHFHGMTQFRTPYMDGDDMVTNCPIPAGYSHTYEFVAHPAGTTFYHSHSGSQRVSGMTGPLVVVDPDEPYADLPDRHVFIQDWFNQVRESGNSMMMSFMSMMGISHITLCNIRRIMIATLSFGVRILVSIVYYWWLYIIIVLIE